MFWANIGIIGGNTKFSGFHERLYAIAVIRTACREMVLTLNQHDGTSLACPRRLRDKHLQERGVSFFSTPTDSSMTYVTDQSGDRDVSLRVDVLQAP